MIGLAVALTLRAVIPIVIRFAQEGMAVVITNDVPLEDTTPVVAGVCVTSVVPSA
jgi:hypothetical protein